MRAAILIEISVQCNNGSTKVIKCSLLSKDDYHLFVLDEPLWNQRAVIMVLNAKFFFRAVNCEGVHA